MNCQKCNHPIAEDLCAACANPVAVKRIDKHYISHEILHLLHFEKGIFYTIKELLVRPGHSIREFINGDRAKHMKPVAFLIVTSLLFTIFGHLFHIEEFSKGKLQLKNTHITDVQTWVETHFGYANIIMGGFIALFVKLLFRKYKYNLFEITVLLCYVMGQGMFLLTIETLFSGLLNAAAFNIILTIIGFAYPTWAIGQFFDGKKTSSYVKAFLSYILGYALFDIVIALVGLAADLVLGTPGTH